MTEKDQPYNNSELYTKRLQHIEDILTPTFALLLNDGFTYNDVRCMLLDSTTEFVNQQISKQLKELRKTSK